MSEVIYYVRVFVYMKLEQEVCERTKKKKERLIKWPMNVI